MTTEPMLAADFNTPPHHLEAETLAVEFTLRNELELWGVAGTRMFDDRTEHYFTAVPVDDPEEGEVRFRVTFDRGGQFVRAEEVPR